MDGILPLWKERGMTSHDCVFKLRKILHTKKNWSWWYVRSRCRRGLTHLRWQRNESDRIHGRFWQNL